MTTDQLPPAVELDRPRPVDALWGDAAFQAIDDDYFRRRSAGEFAWSEMGVGVALAAGLFPTVLTLLWVLVGVPLAMLFFGAGVPGVGDVFAGAIGLLAGAGVAFCAAFMIAGFTAAATLPAMVLVVHLLGVRARQTHMACFAGGAVTLVVSGVVWASDPVPWGLVLIFPGLATPFGQYGAGYVTLQSETLHRLRLGLFEGRRSAPDEDRRVRFSLRQMLGLMVVVSLLLTGLQLGGLMTPRVLVVLVAWSVYQAATWWLTVWLIDRRYRKAARQYQPGTPDERSP